MLNLSFETARTPEPIRPSLHGGGAYQKADIPAEARDAPYVRFPPIADSSCAWDFGGA